MISNWSHKWGLTISHSKTAAIIFTQRVITGPTSLSIDGKSLHFSSKVKFLGLTFDRRLTWKPHIDNIVSKCRSDIQVLRIITFCKWSSDYDTLLRIYTALILSKIDYSCFLYGTAARSHLDKLDRIQYACIRLILGALKCTPTYKLEAEANIMPLDIRRRQLLSLYCSRICSIADHPVKKIIIQHNPAHSMLGHKYSFPCLDRIHDEFNNLDIDPKLLPCIKMTTKYRYQSLNVKDSLSTNSKKSLTDAEWRSLFSDLVKEEYSNCELVFTDGSQREGLSGCGVWSGSHRLLARLPTYSSVFTCELYAIYSAVEFFCDKPGRFVIFTDSLSSIRAIKSLNKSSHYLVSWIVARLLGLGSKIALDWLPSHVGIEGNEQADSLAAQSLSLLGETNIPRSQSELRQYLCASYYSEWQARWQATDIRLRNLKMTLGPVMYKSLPRREQVVLSRFRLGSTILTHGHYFSGGPPNKCESCSSAKTIKHVLVDCPLYESSRAPLRLECTSKQLDFSLENLLSGRISYPTLVEFLKNTRISPYIFIFTVQSLNDKMVLFCRSNRGVQSQNDYLNQRTW